jgi:hypothetical protein
MTITSQASRWAYTGNGATTDFAYTNRIFAAADLRVYVAGLLQALGSHYAVSGVGAGGGGTVSFAAAPADGASVVIERDVPATQDVDYQPNDPFPAETHERALDKLTVLAQQLASRLARTFAMAGADPASGFAALPFKAALANRFLAFDGAGDPIAAAGTSADLGPVSGFVAGLLAAGDAAAARALLGAAATGAANTFAGAATFAAAVTLLAGLGLRWVDDGAAEGPVATLDRQSASPAANDLLGAIAFDGRSTAGTARTAARLLAQLLDPADGAEAGRLLLQTIAGGALATRAAIGQGLVVGAPAGGDMGAGSINAAAIYREGTAIAFQGAYESAEQTITAAGGLTLAHGLGRQPRLVVPWLRCKTAEHGYAPNDELALNPTGMISGDARSLAIVPDATNVFVRFGNSGGFNIPNKSTGATGTTTAANWRLVIRAYA